MPFVSFLPTAATWASAARHIGRALIAAVLMGASIVLAGWLTLQWGILPRVERWRPQIEQWASQAVGAPVHIEAIDVTGGLWSPAVTLHNVRVQGPAGQDALTLSNVRALLVPRSLLPASLTHWEPRFEQLLIEGPVLDIRRDASGKLWIGGLALGRIGGTDGTDAADDDSPVLDWLLRQREIALRRGQLRWTDETRDATPLALTDVDVVLRNALTRHRLRIDATPPPDWGDRLTLQADLRHSLLAVTGLRRAGDWRHWRGQVHVSAPLIDAHQLHRYVQLPVTLHEGRAALRAWLQVTGGELSGASIDLALRDVSVTLGQGLEPLTVTTLTAQIDAERDRPGLLDKTEGLRLDVRRLVFGTGDGVQWPLSDIHLAVHRHPDGTVRNGSVEASVLDLPVLADLATRVPLAGPVRQLIEQATPQGRLLQARLRWQGTMEAPTSWWTAGRAQAMSLTSAAAQPEDTGPLRAGRPGLRNADLDFEFTDRGGHATVRMTRGALELPGVFEDALVPLDHLDADVRWRIDHRPGQRPAIEVDVPRATFANADAQGQFDARWRTGATSGPTTHANRSAYLPGHIDLHARLTQGDAARVHRYLPLGLPAGARHYVRDAVRSGHVREAVARVRGDLSNFPFARPGSGEFWVQARVNDVDFAYVPPEGAGPHWPAFTQAEAELLFDPRGMQVRRGQARVAGVGSGTFLLSQVEGDVADFLHAPLLRIAGRGRGPADDALAYLRQSPVGAMMGHALDPSTSTGSTDLQLDLSIPLDHPDRTEVRGSVVLAGNTVQLRPDVPTLVDARARVDFHSHGFTLKGGTAQALGGTVTFDGTQEGDGALRITAQGTASAEGLRRNNSVPLLAWLGGQLSGQAPYRLQMAFQEGGRAEVQLTSPLTGMASRLPAPLAKPANEPWPLKVSLVPQRDSSQHLLRVEMANGAAAPTLLDAMYLREVRPDGSAAVVRGALGLGAAATLPSPQEPAGTVTATLAMPQVMLDPWLDWADRLTTPASAQPPVRATESANSDDIDTYLPDRTTLRTAQFGARGLRLSGVVATIDRQRAFDGPRPVTDWRIDLLADQAVGRIDWRDAGGSGTTRTENSRLRAALSRWSVTPDLRANAPAASTADTTASSALSSLPAMDVVIDELVWHGKSLGRVELQAANRSDPREWRIAKLAMTLPEAQLSAQGNWAPLQAGVTPGNSGRTALSFTLALQDGGRLLDRFGPTGALRGGAGEIKGQVAWSGSPMSVDWPSLGGELRLQMDNGQFLRIDPGIGRLLSVFSLQSLPRRLLFDFRDVFREGFSFDRIDGDARIARGVATTHNLRVRGVQAMVLTEGTADLVNEAQDLNVWVVPDINAGAASLAYAAINPAIGLGTLIGQLFLRKSMAEAATRQFHVTGTWQAPRVDAVEGDLARPSPIPDAGSAAPQRE